MRFQQRSISGGHGCATDRGFTLVELLVVIGIIAVMIAILMPALHKARATAYQTACLSNLRSLGQAMLMYANENGGSTPVNQSQSIAAWPYKLYPYVSKNPVPGIQTYKPQQNWHPTIFNCPGGPSYSRIKQSSDLGYVYAFNTWLRSSRDNSSIYQRNGHATKLTTIKRPSDVFLFVEVATRDFTFTYYWVYHTDNPLSVPSTILTRHHSRGTNALFVDGHAIFMNESDWPRQANGQFVVESNDRRWNGK